MNQTLEQQYVTESALRDESLLRVRICSAMSDPTVLPPEGLTRSANPGGNSTSTPDQQLPEPNQSMGWQGTVNLSARWMQNLWTGPWFTYEVDNRIDNDPKYSSEFKQFLRDRYALEAAAIIAQFNSSGLDAPNTRRSAMGFRTSKAFSCRQLIVTGDTLEHMTDDWRNKVFRRNQYTTMRDTSGDVMHHLVCEGIDILSLTEKEREAAGFTDRDWKDKQASERYKPLYTLVDWNPETKKWVVRYECNKKQIGEKDDEPASWYSTVYSLAPGDNYGRGYVESLIQRLLSYNKFSRAADEMAGILAKMLLQIDNASTLTERDLAKRSGSVIKGGTINPDGRSADVGIIAFPYQRDLAAITAHMTRQEMELAKAFLIESSITPQKERTTAFQVSRVQQELDMIHGGQYDNVAEQQQMPVIRYGQYLAKKQNLFGKPDDAKMADMMKTLDSAKSMRILTGTAAMEAARGVERLMTFAQVTSLIPNASQAINYDVLMRSVARKMNLDEPGLIKTKAEMEAAAAAEQNAQVEAATAAAAAQQTIKSAGAVAEANLSTQPV